MDGHVACVKELCGQWQFYTRGEYDCNSVSRTRGPYGQHAVLRLSRRYCAIIFAARRTPCLCLKTVHRTSARRALRTVATAYAERLATASSMFALRRGLQQCARSLLPMEALACGSLQQSAAVTSGPAGAVYNVGKASLGLSSGLHQAKGGGSWNRL